MTNFYIVSTDYTEVSCVSSESHFEQKEKACALTGKSLFWAQNTACCERAGVRGGLGQHDVTSEVWGGVWRGVCIEGEIGRAHV